MFLFHIARLFEYPIADQNVFRAFVAHKKTKIPENLNEYKQYSDYFFNIALSSRIISGKSGGKEKDIKEIVCRLKKVDNALFMFGEFLNKYNIRVKKK